MCEVHYILAGSWVSGWETSKHLYRTLLTADAVIVLRFGQGTVYFSVVEKNLYSMGG